MDVMKPALIRIGGRCYRKNPIERKTTEVYEEEEINHLDVANDEAYYDDEMCDAFACNIEESDKGFRLVIDVPSPYFKYIIGKKGETKRRLENETRTQIKIPRQGDEGDIVVLGRDRKGVISAKTRIDLLVNSARQKQPFTHFLSIPITSKTIKDKFMEFKEDVCRFCSGDRGLDDTIFQNPNKLHLTLGTMALLSDTEISKAKALLQECQSGLIEPILRGTRVLSQLRGLEYMNDDPNAVDVLYAKIELQDDSDRLQILVDQLAERFTSAGLMQKEYDRVKLHATVMNTLMRKDPSGASVARSDGGRGGARESFDAGNVLENYGDYNFGPYHIDTVHISQRYGTGTDGYYSCEASLELP